ALIGSAGPQLEQLLSGMLSGMEGRTKLATPPNWQAVSSTIQRSGGKAQELAGDISAVFGDSEATQRAFVVLHNKRAPVEARKRALRTLAAQQQKDLIAELPNILKDAALRKEAIRSVAAFDNEALGRLLVERYPGYSQEEKAEVVRTLSSRAVYGALL